MIALCDRASLDHLVSVQASARDASTGAGDAAVHPAPPQPAQVVPQNGTTVSIPQHSSTPAASAQANAIRTVSDPDKT